MKTLTKVGIVLAGYVLAFAAASAVVAHRVATTAGPDRTTYAAMYDFGDLLLFLAVIGIASVPATGAALFFLRPWRPLWVALTRIGVVCGVASPVAAFFYFAGRVASGLLVIGAQLGLLFMFVTPVISMASLVAGAVAPDRASRVALIVSGVVEAASFGVVVLALAHAAGAL